VDIDRVLAGTLWFFNNHLLILQRISNGENPAALELNLTEFWIQVHELPPRLMTESMAKQFGDFCGKFTEYDTFIPSLGLKKYMRIRVCLDVSASLKCKKKVQIGKSMTVYARFKYEKLSLFCFICGKLGHGESYCPFQLRVEPSKIIFGWDLSLRAVVRCRNLAISRWLRAADGSQCNAENLESLNQSFLLNEDKDSSRNLRGIIRKDLVTDGLVNGPMDLVLEEENDPIGMLEGNKRQRIVEGPRVLLEPNAGTGSMDVSASSGIKAVRLNENAKLECSWFGKITNSKKTQE
ncbi:hypothetical protein Goarm_007298, partial [Gossypium armourianum]|nr:hypothetical protein [Gossypium armourianum]